MPNDRKQISSALVTGSSSEFISPTTKCGLSLPNDIQMNQIHKRPLTENRAAVFSLIAVIAEITARTRGNISAYVDVTIYRG